jgi:cysteinyl-tRNA synthetase
VTERLDEARRAFGDAMRDDLNTAAALGAMFELVRAMNVAIDSGRFGVGDADAVRAAFAEFDRVLGVISLRAAEDRAAGLPAEEVERLIEARHAARRNRDFAEADRIRAALAAQGVLLEDSSAGTRWKRK